jgi:[ribosomal protein S18]-alanine N-acetyltransferase
MAEVSSVAGLRVRPLERHDAEAVAAWRYQGPWRVYDPRPGDEPLSSAVGYHAVVDGEGTLVGFVCIGQEARVPGLPAADGITDVGVGMRPDLVGQGLGPAFGTVALDHVRRVCGDGPLRVVVQSWNERSLRLARRLGFREAGSHACVQDGGEVSYTVLIRAADSSAQIG